MFQSLLNLPSFIFLLYSFFILSANASELIKDDDYHYHWQKFSEKLDRISDNLNNMTYTKRQLVCWRLCWRLNDLKLRWKSDPLYALNDYRNAKVQRLVGLYCNGQGIEEDCKKAFQHAHFAAANNPKDAQAQLILGLCYEHGQGVERDFKKAFQCYRLVQADDADAQICIQRIHVLLGFYYEIGADDKKAIQHYYLATQRRASSEAKELVSFYNKCQKIGIDFEMPFEIHQFAAEHGSKNALVNLGICYENGINVEKNLVEAFKSYQRAAEAGNHHGEYYLGNCYEKGHGVTENFSDAQALYFLAAAKGNTKALFHLGLYYESKKDIDRAVEFYQRAAKLYHSGASAKLKLMLPFKTRSEQELEGPQTSVGIKKTWPTLKRSLLFISSACDVLYKGSKNISFASQAVSNIPSYYALLLSWLY